MEIENDTPAPVTASWSDEPLNGYTIAELESALEWVQGAMGAIEDDGDGSDEDEQEWAGLREAKIHIQGDIEFRKDQVAE